MEGQDLEEAQDDATLIAIRDMERAGVDIITDGEMRRESYSNRFATALEGVDIVNPGPRSTAAAAQSVVPRIVGPIKAHEPGRGAGRRVPARETPRRKIKITLPGPFTMTQQAQDDYYRDEEALAMAFAAAVNEEMRDLKAAGADVIQLDEPWLQARADRAARYGVKAINRALQGIEGTRWCTVLRLRRGGARTSRAATRSCRSSPNHRVADLDRGGAAAPRPRRPQGTGRRRSCSA